MTEKLAADDLVKLRRLRRRIRYQTDPDYRANCIRNSRNTYIKNSESMRQSQADAAEAAEKIDQTVQRPELLGFVREAYAPDNRRHQLRCLTSSEVAGLLLIDTHVFYRWVREDKWPPPPLTLVKPVRSSRTLAYPVEQAVVLAKLYAEHLRRHPKYVVSKHEEFRSRLFSEAAKVEGELFGD